MISVGGPTSGALHDQMGNAVEDGATPEAMADGAIVQFESRTDDAGGIHRAEGERQVDSDLARLHSAMTNGMLAPFRILFALLSEE